MLPVFMEIKVIYFIQYNLLTEKRFGKIEGVDLKFVTTSKFMISPGTSF